MGVYIRATQSGIQLRLDAELADILLNLSASDAHRLMTAIEHTLKKRREAADSTSLGGTTSPSSSDANWSWIA